MTLLHQQLIHTTIGKLLYGNKTINTLEELSTYPQGIQQQQIKYIIIINNKRKEEKCYFQ